MTFASPRPARLLVGLLTSALLGSGLAVLGASAPASAAVADPSYNVVDRSPQGVTADALPTVQIDGVVWDTAINGDTVYAGGQFANARPAGAAAGTNQTTRNNLLSFNIRTGVMNAAFGPNVNGRIRAMTLSPDKSRLYIVGAFTQVNGVTRSRIAAFNTSDGSLVTSFAPVVNSDAFTVQATNTAVYIGGWFTKVNNVARTRLAAVSATDGSLLGWAPTADATVNTMTLTPDGSRVVVGGTFSQLNGSTSLGLGWLGAADGTYYPMPINSVVQNYGQSAGIYSLHSDANNVYGTAYWFGGTGNFEGMFVADAATGAVKSMADCHGDTYDSTVANGIVYTVSHHHDCSNINAFPDTNPRNRWKRANAFTLNATTTVGHNTAGGYYDFYGQPAPSVYNWFPDVSVGSYTGQSQGGWTTESTSEYVIEGGEFPNVNNVGQQGLVRFAIPSLATNKQGPRVSAADSAPKLRGLSGSSVRVSWPSNWDRDDMSLTYKVFRQVTGSPATQVFTQTKQSTFWNLPTQTFTDNGLTAGTTYNYWVTATDPNGNTLKSSSTSIVAGADVVDNSAYAQAVTADGASHYWRLDEKAGETTSTDWAGGNDLVLGTGVTNGTAGAVNGSPDTAATFDGTANGTAGETSTEVGPSVFTAEAWIKTTTTSGGKILGFGNSQLGTSGSYDRHVYMDNAGHLTFGVYPGGVRVVTTGGTYNDGAWHQVVASLSPAGMKLYVDGLLEGTDESTTGAQGYDGYWRIGGDNLGGWPATGSSQTFNGAIDDVSIYPTALSSTQVRNHYTSTGRTVNLPPAPNDAYGQQVYADNPSFLWRLNEPAGATAVADASQGRNPGTAANGVTFGAASTVAPGTAAQFDGSDDTIASNRSFTNPRNYSEEAWFSTTTTHGGKIIGFGDKQSGYSGNYDRHVYMENSGQLTYGVWTGQANVITTPQAYNDGRWHHLVATQSTTDGMKLYLDGRLIGTNPQTDAQAYTGYWRVGGDTSWGGDSSFFNGTIDEAAVYPVALTADQVQNHYYASDASVNAAPVAAFTSACDKLTCSFDGTTSNDPDGTLKSWAWDFGDGNKGTGSTTPHSYLAAGTYTVALTVTDNAGKSTTTTQQVTVTAPPPNQAPVAEFTSSCVERTCTFDSSPSKDADGTVAGWNWDFGDGTLSTDPKPQHSFAKNGTFTVTLQVSDDQGATSKVSHDVTVAAANVKPTAKISTNVTDLTVVADGSGSTDVDGTIASYAWDHGDGSAPGTGKTDTHTYAAAGTYTVTLTVTDDKGATDTTTAQVSVVAPNVKPTAKLSTNVTDLTVAADGSGSTDSDGTIASYAWDYGDSKTGSGKTDSHTYAAAGTYTVTLTVTDDRGATDKATAQVTVTAPNVKPTAKFTSTVTNLGVAVDASGSTDSDGTVASYAWDYGDSKTGSGKTDSHTYAAAGTYTVTLTVTDDKGATDKTSAQVTVAAAPVSNVVAADTFSRTGSKWGTADTGGTWSESSSGYFSTNGSQGVIATKASAGPTVTLGSVSALDSTTTTQFSLDKLPTGSSSGGYYLWLGARKQGTSLYRLKVRVLPDGSVQLTTASVVSGTETAIKSVTVSGLTYKAGDVLNVRYDVSGTGTTTLSAKVWKSTGTEPAAAQLTSTSTVSGLQSAGAVDLSSYLSSSSTVLPTVTVDNYKVTKG